MRILSIIILLASNSALAADVGDTYKLLLDCQKTDGVVTELVPIAFDVYSPGPGNSNQHHLFVVEKIGEKHARTKVAKLADSHQFLRNGKPVVEIGPLAGQTKLSFESVALKEGKPFTAALQNMNTGEQVTTYDCDLEK